MTTFVKRNTTSEAINRAHVQRGPTEDIEVKMQQKIRVQNLKMKVENHGREDFQRSPNESILTIVSSLSSSSLESFVGGFSFKKGRLLILGFCTKGCCCMMNDNFPPRLECDLVRRLFPFSGRPSLDPIQLVLRPSTYRHQEYMLFHCTVDANTVR